MKIEDVAKLSPVDRFLYWIKERHAIYTRRKAGKKKPWTDDEVLRSYFFTNPYRENDKTTVWFRENVREPLRDDPAVLMATVIFRWFNWIPTGELLLKHNLLEDWRPKVAKVVLGKMRDRGEKVFTGAFMIAPRCLPNESKVEAVCRLIGEVYNNLGWMKAVSVIGNHKMQVWHDRLLEYDGLGGFMAYEIVCDLRYTYLLENAPDKETWSNPGPGAKRGLNRILGNPIKSPLGDYPKETLRLLITAQRRLKKLPPIEMREIEHSLCEWDKYERARLQDGRMKRLYNGVA